MDHRRFAIPAIFIVNAMWSLPTEALAASADKQLDDIERQIGIAEGAAARLEARLAVKDPSRSNSTLMARINEGLVYHQLGEYKRASLVLLRVVDDPANADHAVYQDALFYLGDALYQDRNFAASESYFREVLKRNFDAYYKDALLRLIEISFITHRHKNIDKYFAELKRRHGQAALDPKFPYVIGRTLYRRGAYKQALDEFMAVPRGSAPYLQARYLAAVTHVNVGQAGAAKGNAEAAEKRYRTAIELLTNALKDQQPKTDDDYAVVDLMHLTLGRLHYEVSEFAQSVDHYQEISRESAWFDHALYEVCWTYVKNKEYDKALRALDILLLALPNSPFAPEAALVRGNLQLRLERYDDASDTFDTLLTTFEPVKAELDAVVRKNPDPVAYFNKVIAENEDKFDVSVVLPPLAAGWVTTKDEVARALVLVGDLQTARKDMAEAESIIEKLETQLGSGNRVEIFGDLRQVAGDALERQKSLVLLKKRLNDIERKLVVSHANEADKRELDAVGQARKNAESDFSVVPTTDAEVRQREAKVEKSMDKLEGQAFELSLAIDSIQAQLRAFEKYMADLKTTETSRVTEAHLEKAVTDEVARLRTLEKELKAARKTIEFERRGVGMGDAVTTEEGALKDKFSATLDKEAELFAKLRVKAGTSNAFGRLDAARRRVDRASERLTRIRGMVDSSVDEETKRFGALVRTEKARLASYTGTVQGFGGATENLAGRIAYDNFENVRQLFEGIVLKADVGRIDVAWARKEQTTVGIDGVLGERKVKLGELDTDYAPLRGEGP